MDMSFDFEFMLVALKAALKYTPNTLILAVVPLIMGLFFGTLIAIARLFNIRFLSNILQGLVVLVKGIPMVLLLLMVFFGVIQGFDTLSDHFHWKLKSKDIDLMLVAIIALSISAIAYLSEAIRGALLSVNKGQYEAAYSIGLTRTQTLKRIIIPQAFPVAIPMICSNFIGLVKASSLAFMISVTDLMNGALITATANYKFLEAYIAAAVVYWVLCMMIEKGSSILERKFNIYSKGGVI